MRLISFVLVASLVGVRCANAQEVYLGSSGSLPQRPASLILNGTTIIDDFARGYCEPALCTGGGPYDNMLVSDHLGIVKRNWLAFDIPSDLGVISSARLRIFTNIADNQLSVGPNLPIVGPIPVSFFDISNFGAVFSDPAAFFNDQGSGRRYAQHVYFNLESETWQDINLGDGAVSDLNALHEGTFAIGGMIGEGNITSTPEPSTVLLTVTGLVAIAGLHRRGRLRHRALTPLATSVMALALLAASAGAQTRPLYVTDNFGPKYLYTFQGGVATNQVAPGTYCTYGLAVVSSVRTVGCNLGSNGQEYTLGLTPVGAQYTNTSSIGFIADGTTDGTYNYAADVYTGQVWRAALDWSGLTPLFSTAASNLAGITYDSGTNSLWLGEFGGNQTIFHYTMSGALLSSFAPGVGGSAITALAYDAADQTLWFSNYTETATLFQYTTAGVQLGSVNVSGTYGGYLLGAEYQLATVPEPASPVLLGTGLIGIAGVCCRRRRH